MKRSQVDDNRVLNVWSWCSEAYLRAGRKLSLPAGTDPAKTYQWRYAAAIAKKFEEWDLDDDAAKKFIDIAVRTAKERGMLQKGLAILHQANMLQLCYEKLVAECDNNKRNLDSLRHVRAWFVKKVAGRDALEMLLGRANPDEFCNLTMWYQASRLPPLYLALSSSCRKALARLNRDCPDERGMLPRHTELHLLREEFLKDAGNLKQARDIFAQDWREPCLLPS